MNTKNNFLLSIIFACFTLNCITSDAQEEKSADIVHQKSLLSFLPQETPGTRTAKNSAQAIAAANFADYKKRGEVIDVWVTIPSTPIDWDNVPKIEKISNKTIHKENSIDEIPVSKEISDHIGLLNTNQTVKKNLCAGLNRKNINLIESCCAIRSFVRDFKRQEISTIRNSHVCFDDLTDNAQSSIKKILSQLLRTEAFHKNTDHDEKIRKLKFLIHAGADIDEIVPNCITKHNYQTSGNVLHGAIYTNDYELTALLLTLGADPNQENDTGFTPLHFASYQNSSITTSLLLGAGADVNKFTKQHGSPLYVASDKVVPLLLAMGAEVNAVDTDGWTALHAAFHWNSKKVIPLLLAAGIDSEIVDNKGRKACFYATHRWDGQLKNKSLMSHCSIS